LAKNAVETATALGLQPRSSLERWPEAKQQREDNPQSVQNVIMLVLLPDAAKPSPLCCRHESRKGSPVPQLEIFPEREFLRPGA
jgi:hypothetical protein